MHPGIDGASTSTSTSAPPARPHVGSVRERECARVAAFLDTRAGGATRRELDAACDVGCMTKVLSDMLVLGYVLRKQRGHELRSDGVSWRRVRVYVLIARPEVAARQQCLDLAIEGHTE